MKKIIILCILFTLLLCGCSSNNNNDNDKDKDNDKDDDGKASSNTWIVNDYDDSTRIWVINDYQSLTNEDYYSKIRIYENSQDLIRIQARDSQLKANYDVDLSKGFYVQTLKVVESSYNEETNTYTIGSSEEVDKQYFIETNIAQKYKSIGVSDGYWFYFEKYTGDGDALVRVNYKGEEQLIMDDFDLNDCLSISYPDSDVLYILKYNSFSKDYQVKLYVIYMYNVSIEKIDSQIINFEDYPPYFLTQNDSYHILYQAENPDYTNKKQYLEDNNDILDDLLSKYNVQLKESSEANDQFNSLVLMALIYKEYGINSCAVFNYDVINKEVSYEQIAREIDFPTDEYNPYK